MEKDLESATCNVSTQGRTLAAGTINGRNWMGQLNDDVLLSALSIPGTHDSAAYTLPVPFIMTQRMTIKQQLDSGCRYFDLRCGLVKDILEMVHGSQRLNLTLDEILGTMYDWLNEHPSEALIVQLKKDRADQESTLHFSNVVKTTLFAGSAWWRVGNTIPRLGDVRGKIQLFRRFRGPNLFGYGMNVSRWRDNPDRPFTMDVGHHIYVTVQDHYKYIESVPLPTILAKKEAEILEVMKLSAADHYCQHWYINFTSTMEFNWYYRYSPQDLAEGGNYHFTHQKGINDRLMEYLIFSGTKKRHGIVAMDFPPDGLVTALYTSNFADVCYHSVFMLRICLCLLLLLVAFEVIADYRLTQQILRI